MPGYNEMYDFRVFMEFLKKVVIFENRPKGRVKANHVAI